MSGLGTRLRAYSDNHKYHGTSLDFRVGNFRVIEKIRAVEISPTFFYHRRHELTVNSQITIWTRDVIIESYWGTTFSYLPQNLSLSILAQEFLELRKFALF